MFLFLRTGEGVDSSIEKDKLYAVLAIHPASQSIGGFPALFDSPGAAYDGGFAEYVVVRQDQLVSVVRNRLALTAASGLIVDCSLPVYPRNWLPSLLMRASTLTSLSFVVLRYRLLRINLTSELSP